MSHSTAVRRLLCAASSVVLLATLAVPARSAAAPTPPAPVPAKTVPISVALNPYLTVPQPTDSAKTAEAREKLKGLTDSYKKANQDYNLATEELRKANTELVAARVEAKRAQNNYDLQQQRLAVLARAIYMGGGGIDKAGALLASTEPDDFLRRLGMQAEVSRIQAFTVAASEQAKQQRDAALKKIADLQARKDKAHNDSIAALDRATAAVTSAQEIVATLHTDDLLLAARQLAGNAASPAEAAEAMRAQVIATAGATAEDFAEAQSPAAIISVAARAMLRQAAGLSPAPKQVSGGASEFTASRTEAVDTQAVMGPVPDVGKTAPYAAGTGAGPVRALEDWNSDPTGVGYPNKGVGIKGQTPAPLLPANGVTVRPVLPKAEYKLRAEVAVDAALQQLGLPYVFAAAGNDTFDCSGLTLWAWGHAGVKLGHYTGWQVKQGINVAPNQWLPGDLILFGSDLHHVAFYLGAGFVIHAPYTGTYVSIARVSSFGDYAVAVRP